LSVVFDADLAQVVGLLEVDRILIAGRATGPQGDDLVVERIFNVLRRSARGVSAHQVQLTGGNAVHGVVVVDRERLAVQTFKLDHGNGLVGRTFVVGSFPPTPRLRIDNVAIDVDVRN